MGNWKNRRTRRFFYQKVYIDPASSYYDSDEPSPPLPAFSEDGVPSWEKKFCSLIGSVPWRKIVNAKKFMSCHGCVINWDDSAAEEAFQSAKKRFWAEINGIPNEHPLPNPDMHIDEINWSSNIDPDLIKDIEQAFFSPEEEENGCKRECTNKMVLFPSESWNKSPGEAGTSRDCNIDKSQGWNLWPDSTNNSSNMNNNDNPWENCIAPGNGVIKGNTWGDYSTSDELPGWNHTRMNANQLKDWNNCTLNNNDNPWEQSFSQKNESAKDNSWEDGIDNRDNQLKNGDTSGKPWKCSSRSAAHFKAWGQSGHTYWGTNKREMGKINNGGNHWESNFGWGSERSTDGQWRRHERRSGSGWRSCDDHYRVPKDLEFRQLSGGQGTWAEVHKKREGRHQYVTGNKHVKFGENSYQTGNYWRGGSTKKRASFPYE